MSTKQHRVLVVGDIHASDQSPGYRTETYGEDILTKLEETVTIAKERKVTAVLWLGDVFDQKRANRISFKLVKRLATILRSYGVPVYILVGNHDISAANLESLQKQPLGMLEEVDNVTLLTTEPILLDEEVAIYPVPGIAIRHLDNWLDYYITGGDEKRRIIAAHQLIAKNLEEYPAPARPSFQDSKAISAVTDADLILYGDLHTKQGGYKQGNVWFSNFGSICRMAASDVEHEPEVIVLVVKDDEDRNFAIERCRLTSVKPADEVFRLEQHYETKEHSRDIQDTIRKLKETRLHKFSLDSVIEDIRVRDDVDTTVQNRALELLEHVR